MISNVIGYIADMLYLVKTAAAAAQLARVGDLDGAKKIILG